MTTYTVKPSPDKKGWCVDVTGPGGFKSYIANSTTFPTKEEAEAYCDRLNKLFGEKANG
jgi:hypothetical protein